MTSRSRRSHLQVEDWIELSQFYMFNIPPSSTITKGTHCVALLCEKAPRSRMLYDLVQFCCVAFHDDLPSLHQLNNILIDYDQSDIIHCFKENLQKIILQATDLKKANRDALHPLGLTDNYLTFGLLYNLTYGNKNSKNVDTIKFLLSQDSLQCRLVYPFWNLAFCKYIKQYGVHYSTMLIDELVDIPVTLLAEFLSILKYQKACKAPLSATSKLIGIKVDTVDHRITLFLPEFHIISLRAVLLFLCLCSFCIDLSTFQVVLHEDTGFSVWKVLDLLEMLHPKFSKDKQFYKLVNNILIDRNT
ncbi:hypothetical protein P9112_010738 [Eukaryota sp. TZLM1-RC]